MNVEIGAEAALFPEKEYISAIFVAVRGRGGLGEAEMGIPGLLLSTRRHNHNVFTFELHSIRGLNAC